MSARRRSPDRRHRGMDPFKAGLLALAAILVFTYAGFTKFRNPVAGHYEIHAIFRTAATEINKNSPIRIAGVEVGRVAGVTHGPGGTADVTLRIEDKGRPIHTDATAKIRPRLFLEGNFFVDLRPGTPGTPEIKDGGTIPLAQTAIPVQVDQVLQTLERPERADLQATIRNVATALDKGGAQALNASFPLWQGAFTNTAIVADAARGERPGDLARFVAGQARVSRALASRDRDLANLVTNFATTVTTLAERRSDLGESLRALDRTLTTAGPALTDLRTVLGPLQSFGTALRPALAIAPGALGRAIPFVRDATQLVSPSELPQLTAALGPAARRLRTVEPQLVDLLGRVTPVADCVTDKVVPVLNSTVDDGKLSTGQPVWQEIARTGVGLAAAGSTFDANGNVIRYGAGGGENLVTTQLPGVGDVYALTPQPLLGARPRWTPGTVPPFAPNARCTDQERPNLAAASAPAPSQRRISETPGQARAAVASAVRRLESLTTATKLRDALKAAATRDRKAAR